MQDQTQNLDWEILDLGSASVETKGPYAEGPIEIMGHRAPIGLSDD
jgi:hypothetical protein